MSSAKELFVSEPSKSSLLKLKRAELLEVADHYKISCSSSSKKEEIRSVILEHLLEEEIISEDEGELSTSSAALELKRLQFQENERVRENALRMKELEIKEKELALQMKLKELEAKAVPSPEPVSKPAGFDISKHVRFVPPFQEREIDKYFLHFEKVATSLEWPKDVWTFLLQSVLVGKAREVYAALSLDQSSNYDVVKSSILNAYELVPEAYRQKFRDSKKGDNQTYVEFAHDKERLFDRWCVSMGVDSDFKRLRELMLLEEFKTCLPNELKTYLEEQKVTTLHQAAVRSDDYSLTHRPSFGKAGQTDTRKTSDVNGNKWAGPANSSGRQSRFPSGPTCFYCKKKGHVMAECRSLEKKNQKLPKPDLLIRSEFLSPNRSGHGNVKVDDSEVSRSYAPFISKGFVSLVGQPAKSPIRILRDTGATQTLILDSVLPFSDNSSNGNSILLQGIELGTLRVPLHRVELSSDIVSGPAVVGVRPSLPVPDIEMILGNDIAGGKVEANPCVSDVPDSSCFDSVEAIPGLFPACAVTRAMAKKASVPVRHEDDEQVGVPGETPPIRGTVEASVTTHDVEQDDLEAEMKAGLSTQELVSKQENDPELEKLRGQAISEEEANKVPVCYYLRNNVLMRKWRPREVSSSHEWRVIHQVVIPPLYRPEILRLAHDTPLAGHLGVNKTYRRILNHFYWPGIRKDVKSFCKTCSACQQVGKPNCKPPLAPLKPIPAVNEPFSQVVIDCVGPLPKTRAGNQYLLTIMCLSTRFPEAVPLRNIKAPSIVKALLKFFTFVGLPRSIQSDQGSNFMSGVFQQVMYQLGIRQFKSTAYHPQSQGALERFHQTLKNMMRTYCQEQSKDWDEGVHMLLFAVRESVQEALGFSPFELVFGHVPRGPLKMLKEVWLTTEDDTQDVITHVTDVRDRLQKATEFARKNLQSAQRNMKTWYDRKARQRTFKPGDKVLALLPIHGHPLQARYCGPFVIEQKMNEVDYVIKTPGRRKAKQLCHINMLKAYYEREPMATVAIASGNVVEEPDVIETECPMEVAVKGPKLRNSEVLASLGQKLAHLPDREQELLKALISDFSMLFPDTPGRTQSIFHDVDVGQAQPVKQHPYRVSPVKLKAMRDEVRYMLDNGIVEPSSSQWSSPSILVPKPDGSYRFCTDFRRVNAVTKTDSFPIPRIDDCIDRIGHARYISKFDLLKGYWQVPLTERAKEVSAFATPDGLYQYCVMPFGMKNAPATFQRMINGVIAGLEGCEAYIDDVVVYGDTWDQHIKQLKAFLSRLHEANLTVNLSKSEFCQARVVFLGHVVGQGEIAPVLAKVQAVSTFPAPGNRHELMRFLGMSGYYRKFCRNFSVVAEPLTKLLQKRVPFIWSAACQAAFLKIKSLLLSVPVLMAPDFLKPFKLMVDASDVGGGAVLLQEGEDGIDHPVCYFSHKFNRHQRNYSTCEKETLSLLLALQHFRVYLEAPLKEILVYTDNNPLVFINKMKDRNQRLLRWSLILQEYSLKICHIRGKDNVIADALSRAM